MRVLVTVMLTSLVFAGCTAPPEEAPSPLFGVCPQWLDGDAQETDLATGANVTIEADFTSEVGNRSLDRFHLMISGVSVDGAMELRAYDDDGTLLRFTDYRDPNAVRTPTFLALDESTGSFDVDIFLSDVTHGASAAPSNLRLALMGIEGATGSLDVVATPGYRVCGAPV